MTLKHPYNILFYRRILRKKKLWDILEDLDSRISNNASGDSTIADKVDALETTVGKASGTGAGGIAKDVSDIKTAVGSEETEGSILARIKALEEAGNGGSES